MIFSLRRLLILVFLGLLPLAAQAQTFNQDMFRSPQSTGATTGAPVAPAGAPSGYPTVNSRFIGRACAKCHANLHGSNSPSGAYFIR